jgi:broad specificity phosphatase PhoE
LQIIMVRHGETIENAEEIIQGHLPGRLSLKGKEQVKKVAKRLQNEEIDYIYSSGWERTKATAKEIIKYHPGVPVEYSELLRERYYGELEGLNIKHYYSREEIKDIESIENLYERARSFYNYLLKKHENDSILLIGHGGINKALIGIITGSSSKDFSTMERLDNTSISVFQIDNDRNYKVVAVNDTKHLKT